MGLTRILSLAYGASFGVRVQMTSAGLEDSLSEPDVAVGVFDSP